LAVLRADIGDWTGALAGFEESISLWREGGLRGGGGQCAAQHRRDLSGKRPREEQRQRLNQSRQFFTSAQDIPGLIGAICWVPWPPPSLHVGRSLLRAPTKR